MGAKRDTERIRPSLTIGSCHSGVRLYTGSLCPGVAMKKIFVLFIFILLLPFGIQARSGSAQPTVVFLNVNVIDATGSPVQPGMMVIIQGDRITHVGKT